MSSFNDDLLSALELNNYNNVPKHLIIDLVDEKFNIKLIIIQIPLKKGKKQVNYTIWKMII